MTLDEAVAISLLTDCSRVGLSDRLRAADPVLLEQASGLLDRARAAQLAGARQGISAIAWNDPRYPAANLIP